MCYCELLIADISRWSLNIVNAIGIIAQIISLKVICKCYFSLCRQFILLGVGDLRYAHWFSIIKIFKTLKLPRLRDITIWAFLRLITVILRFSDSCLLSFKKMNFSHNVTEELFVKFKWILEPFLPIVCAHCYSTITTQNQTEI